MPRYRDLEGRYAFGTVVMDSKPRPFVLELDAGEMTLDEHVTGAPASSLGWLEKRQLEKAVRAVVGSAATTIRIGEYLCRLCDRWIAADSGHWSSGICLSCSLDRDSDYFG